MCDLRVTTAWRAPRVPLWVVLIKPASRSQKARNRLRVAESGSSDLRVTGQMALAASAIWPVESNPPMPIRSPHPDVDVPDVTLTDFVLAGAAARGERPAIVDAVSGAVLTYAQLVEDVDRCAAGLVARGLVPGERVGIWAPNVPEYAVAFHGVARAGGTNTTVNALYTAEEAAFQLRSAGARYLVTVPQLAERALAAASAADVEEVFSIGDAPGTTPFDDLLAAAGTPAPQLAIDPASHLVALPFSSGTTGFPKGVMLTHRNLVANLCQYVPVRTIGEHDRVIAVLPFFHIYGQTLVLNDALRRGATIVTMPRFDLAQFLAAIEHHRITACYVAPPVVLALAKHPLVDQHDLSSLRFITSGAAPLDAELQAAAERRVGCRVQQGYGLTEASPVTHYVHEDDENIHGTIGTLLPSTEARLVDAETAQDAAAGQPGEIWVRGPQVMLGYLGDEDATASTLTSDGWLRTGDIATVDAAGRFRIVDRLKELIKYKGYQVPPAQLEGILLTHPQIADACVVPVRDEEAGEVPKAFVVPHAGQHLDTDEVMAYVAQRVAPHMQVRACELIDAIPKSPSGKLLRRVLVEREREART
jgi:acyl-CoA synthetase (AMP-forming)/AMP-acid ligase II